MFPDSFKSTFKSALSVELYKVSDSSSKFAYVQSPGQPLSNITLPAFVMSSCPSPASVDIFVRTYFNPISTATAADEGRSVYLSTAAKLSQLLLCCCTTSLLLVDRRVPRAYTDTST